MTVDENLHLEYEKSLENLGLSMQQSRVYLSVLKLGNSPASSIAKAAGLQRTTVYHILKSLAKQGLVIVNYRKKERYYSAQNPSTIALRYEKMVADFTNIIPRLNELRSKEAVSFGLRFLETTDEIKSFFADILIHYKDSEYYVISSTPEWMNIDTNFFYKFREDRAKANIRVKLILTDESRRVDPPNNTLGRSAKYLPPTYNFKSSINIFPKEILIVGQELTSLGVVIEIPAMTDIFKSVFEVLWDMLPEN